MATVSGSISSELSDLLTRLAEELYWGNEAYPNDVGLVRERAENYGLEYIDAGQNRLILKIPEEELENYTEPLVAKLPRRYSSPDGFKQNVEEIDIWQTGPDWLREYLIPIEAAHPQGYWLIMRYAPEVQDESTIEESRHTLLQRGILTNELGRQNWGRWHGEVYLIDYGLSVADWLPDTEVRNWVDIVDREDRERGIIEETGQEIENVSQEEREESSEEDELPPADRVIIDASVIPYHKPALRQALRGESVHTGKLLEQDIDSRTIAVEIVQTRPRTIYHSRNRSLQIDDRTRVSFIGSVK